MSKCCQLRNVAKQVLAARDADRGIIRIMSGREQHVSDLRWYFNDAESELGARAQQYEFQSKSTAISFGNSIDQGKAAVKFARIDVVIRSLPLVHQEVLLRWYAAGHYPPNAKVQFDKYVGVVMLTREVLVLAQGKSIVEAFKSLCAKVNSVCPDVQHQTEDCKLSGHPCRKDRKAAVDSVKVALWQAKQLVDAAHAVYARQGELLSRSEAKHNKQQKIVNRKRRTDKLLKIIK